jgi:hypothetical protein
MCDTPCTVPALPTVITAVDNVIRVYYVTDPCQTRDLTYMVKYTLDGVEVVADTYTVIVPVWINDPADVIVVVESISATNDRYIGYQLVNDPFVAPATVQNGDVIIVPYTKYVDEIVMTGINWNNGNGNGNGNGINQFSVNGVTLKNNKNYIAPASFDDAILKAPNKNDETALYTVDERTVTNGVGTYVKVYDVRVALFDAQAGVWKIYGGTIEVNNPGGNEAQTVNLRLISSIS